MAENKLNDDGLTYEQWKAKVNREILAIAGVTADDIGDVDYRSWWGDGVPPKDAAHDALEASDFPFEDGQ